VPYKIIPDEDNVTLVIAFIMEMGRLEATTS
jgi:hypothetical protein